MWLLGMIVELTFAAIPLQHLLSIGVGPHYHILESRPHVGTLSRPHRGSLSDHPLALKNDEN